MLILIFLFLVYIANIYVSFRKASVMNLPVCHLATALLPDFFTKVFKPIISHLRLHGLRITIFLDDILLVASSKQECLDHLQFLRQLITDLGFILNDKNSQLEPSTKLTFLGFIIDSLDMKLYLPQDKIDKTVSACSSLISTASPTIQQVAQVTGLLVSAFPAVPYLRLYYRSIGSCKSRCLSGHNGDYDQHILLSSDVLADLNWVIHNLSQYNGCYFGPEPISLIITSDASLLGWGATCDGQPVQGQWSTLEVSHHINYLELLATFYALQTKCTKTSCSVEA